MNNHKQTYKETGQQTERVGAGGQKGWLTGTKAMPNLTLMTTLLLIAALFFTVVTVTKARPLFATAPSLGTAASFAVLAGSAVNNTGPTIVTGDLGVSPGSAVTGFPPGIVVDGTIHASDAVALQAQNDVTTAYNDLAGQACDTNLTGQDLGGQTLLPGVYCFDTSAQLTGALTLDGLGDADAVFVFQIGSTLTTASDASVLVNNGGSCNVFWQVGSSATLGTGTTFVGNILALTSITLNTGASVSGRTLARNGAVTLDTNAVSGICAALPTATPTPIDTATNTPLPPTPIGTATNTPLPPTPIGTATNTPLPPTPIDTGTPTPMFTVTGTPPTATPTVTGTPPTPTPTPIIRITTESPTALEPANEPSVSQPMTIYLPLVVQ